MADIEWAMVEWSHTPGMTPEERRLVARLWRAARDGTFQIEKTRVVHEDPALLRVAIARARQHGILRGWPDDP